jgi:transcriptional regulator with XRE-family HTH domain
VIYYERSSPHPTTKTLEKIARAFQISPAELLDETLGKNTAKKTGPPSRLQQLSERLATLPRSKQKVAVQMLEGFLQQTGS